MSAEPGLGESLIEAFGPLVTYCRVFAVGPPCATPCESCRQTSAEIQSAVRGRRSRGATAPGASLLWATGPLLRVEPERADDCVDLDRVLAGLQNLPSEEDDQ